METKKEMVKITKNMLLSEIVQMYPELTEVLEGDYGLHCVSCFASEVETLEQGAGGHGMTEEEIGDMVNTLNGLVEDNAKENN